ncbi:unnamed protein product [Nyctereutes procyonoides]|uniref:(raccoon dog) hypothetical protein n=1 Tax=Nyctereutes procyonoides TaxID=34880 RepID=A0A811XQL9_NYCPR|nr:unnamed protein product [Nyctereutes procyonoides]
MAHSSQSSYCCSQSSSGPTAGFWSSAVRGTASGNVLSALHGVWRTQGLSGLFLLLFSSPGLFAGVFPRTAAIGLGGFIFLGAYEQTRSLLLELGRASP